MRIAIVSDIHGNRTAFQTVLADLRETSPDLIFHGDDLADGGQVPLVLRVNSAGAYDYIPIREFGPSFEERGATILTYMANSDTGILLSWYAPH